MASTKTPVAGNTNYRLHGVNVAFFS